MMIGTISLSRKGRTALVGISPVNSRTKSIDRPVAGGRPLVPVGIAIQSPGPEDVRQRQADEQGDGCVDGRDRDEDQAASTFDLGPQEGVDHGEKQEWARESLDEPDQERAESFERSGRRPEPPADQPAGDHRDENPADRRDSAESSQLTADQVVTSRAPPWSIRMRR